MGERRRGGAGDAAEPGKKYKVQSAKYKFGARNRRFVLCTLYFGSTRPTRAYISAPARTDRRPAVFRSLREPSHRRLRTSAVHPVWWLAPRPLPVSAWKYSWKRRRSRQWGSAAKRASPAWQGRWPESSGRKRRQRRRRISSAAAARVTVRPEPAGHSRVR